MFTAFSTALSALDANTTAIDVVSNNLANLNTTGLQGQRGLFPGPGHRVDRGWPRRHASRIRHRHAFHACASSPRAPR